MSEHDMSALMIEHGISVWMDPDWWEGSQLPRWLAGTHIRAEEGARWSDYTSEPPSIEADNTASGDTPIAAVLAAIAKATGGATPGEGK